MNNKSKPQAYQAQQVYNVYCNETIINKTDSSPGSQTSIKL